MVPEPLKFVLCAVISTETGFARRPKIFRKKYRGNGKPVDSTGSYGKTPDLIDPVD
jgi:hypothetical protein